MYITQERDSAVNRQSEDDQGCTSMYANGNKKKWQQRWAKNKEKGKTITLTLLHHRGIINRIRLDEPCLGTIPSTPAAPRRHLLVYCRSIIVCVFEWKSKLKFFLLLLLFSFFLLNLSLYAPHPSPSPQISCCSSCCYCFRRRCSNHLNIGVRRRAKLEHYHVH